MPLKIGQQVHYAWHGIIRTGVVVEIDGDIVTVL